MSPSRRRSLRRPRAPSSSEGRFACDELHARVRRALEVRRRRVQRRVPNSALPAGDVDQDEQHHLRGFPGGDWLLLRHDGGRAQVQRHQSSEAARRFSQKGRCLCLLPCLRAGQNAPSLCKPSWWLDVACYTQKPPPFCNRLQDFFLREWKNCSVFSIASFSLTTFHYVISK